MYCNVIIHLLRTVIRMVQTISKGAKLFTNSPLTKAIKLEARCIAVD